MKIKTEEALSRWVDKIYPSKKEFLKAFKEKKLVFYHGIDPTAPDLHLGHSTNILLLKKLQDLGHKIILLVGDFTAQIGDPTGKSSVRKSLTKKEVLKNCKTYKEQVGKILDLKSKKNPVEFKFNSKWYEKMDMADIIKLLASYTQGKMIKRKMFQKRLKQGQEIYLHEFLYPLLQGYDSVEMNVDAEVGGTDQTFNMLVGRELLKKYKGKKKFVITTPLLENPKTGKKLMSKSEGSYISLQDNPDQMYGKIMALPDEVIIPCFRYCTEVSLNKVKKISNPRDKKTKLAKEIVKMYHGEKKAKKAEKEFNRIFKEKKLPTKIPEIKIKKKKLPILDLLVKIKLASSKSEAKRLILQKGVKMDNKVQKDWKKEIEIKKGTIVQVGKRKFVKIN